MLGEACLYWVRQPPFHGPAPQRSPTYGTEGATLLMPVHTVWLEAVEVGVVTHTEERINHAIAYCTNASRGLSAIAELLVLKYIPTCIATRFNTMSLTRDRARIWLSPACLQAQGRLLHINDGANAPCKKYGETFLQKLGGEVRLTQWYWCTSP